MLRCARNDRAGNRRGGPITSHSAPGTARPACAFPSHAHDKPHPCGPPDRRLRLIRWSIQEIRRIALKLAQRRIPHAHILAWSSWRRAHQANARKAISRKKGNCNARSLIVVPIAIWLEAVAR
ncbi:hypothetical protein DAB18_12955 [Bradyrhizobium sp. WBAH41]|nr:hypothetical protein DAA57_13040 [Bradyrhizobium yuanmingense]QCK04079.1 hypothetical protein DAB18_12955 [Bradyrhizobium sp. WBAH41]